MAQLLNHVPVARGLLAPRVLLPGPERPAGTTAAAPPLPASASSAPASAIGAP
jgi:hypothetical protein